MMPPPVPRRPRIEAPAPAPGGLGSHDMRLRDIVQVVRRQRWFVLGCVAATLLAAVLYLRRATPVFRAIATVQIEAPRPSALTAIQLPEAGGDVETSIEVLRTRLLAAGVVRAIGLQLQVTSTPHATRHEIVASSEVAADAPPRRYVATRRADGSFDIADSARRELAVLQPGVAGTVGPVRLTLAPSATQWSRFTLVVVPLNRATTDFQKSVRITRPNANANLVRIQVESTDPAVARDAADDLAGQFIAQRQAMQTSQAHGTAQFLREQLDTLRGQLAGAEGALQSYRERSGVVDLQAQTTTQIAALAELRAQRGSLDAERQSLGRLLADVDVEARDTSVTGGTAAYRRLIGFPSLFRNQVASELLRSLLELGSARNQLLVRRTPEDPNVRELTTRIASVETQLLGIASTYERGLAAQLAVIDRRIGQVGAGLSSVPADEIEINRLQRAPKALQDIYSLLQTRLKEAEISEASEAPSIRLIDHAALPDQPERPRPILVLALATFAGITIGIGVALLRARGTAAVFDRDDVAYLTGLAVLGVIPTPPSSARRAIRGGGDDGFRRLSATLLTLLPEAADGGRVVAVAAALPRDARSTLVDALAAATAEQGLLVLIVGPDLRARSVGWAAALSPADAGAPRALVARSEVATVRDADSRDAAVTPARLRALFDELRRRADVVFVDTPPVVSSALATLVAPLADAVVLVARVGSTPAAALADAAWQLRTVSAPLLGVILDDAGSPSRTYTQ